MSVKTLADLTCPRVRVEQEDAILVTVTQAATFNAQDLAMLEDLNRTLIAIAALAPPARVVILDAEGNRRLVGAAKPEMLVAADARAGERASDHAMEPA